MVLHRRESYQPRPLQGCPRLRRHLGRQARQLPPQPHRPRHQPCAPFQRRPLSVGWLQGQYVLRPVPMGKLRTSRECRFPQLRDVQLPVGQRLLRRSWRWSDQHRQQLLQGRSLQRESQNRDEGHRRLQGQLYPRSALRHDQPLLYQRQLCFSRRRQGCRLRLEGCRLRRWYRPYRRRTLQQRS